MLISDTIDGEKKMYIGKHFANKTFYNVFGNPLETTIIDSNGYGIFKVHGGAMSVWVTKEMYEDIEINI